MPRTAPLSSLPTRWCLLRCRRWRCRPRPLAPLALRDPAPPGTTPHGHSIPPCTRVPPIACTPRPLRTAVSALLLPVPASRPPSRPPSRRRPPSRLPSPPILASCTLPVCVHGSGNLLRTNRRATARLTPGVRLHRPGPCLLSLLLLLASIPLPRRVTYLPTGYGPWPARYCAAPRPLPRGPRADTRKSPAPALAVKPEAFSCSPQPIFGCSATLRPLPTCPTTPPAQPLPTTRVPPLQTPQ